MRRTALLVITLVLAFAGRPSLSAAPTIFTPTDDATIREGRPDRNYGADAALEVDLSSKKDSLLRFDVTGAAGRPVIGATLRLFVIDASPVGADVVQATSSAWDQASVTWATAPPADGVALGSFGSTAVGSWMTLDVSAVVVGDGPLTFRLSSTSPNGVDYSAQEHPNGLAPELAVEFGALPGADMTPPTPPSNLLAVATSATIVQMSWDASTDNIGIAGYDLYRDGVLLAATGPETTYEDSTAVGGTEYAYSVRGRDFEGNVSDPSATATVTTPTLDTTAPSPPVNLVATAMCTFRLPAACYAAPPVEVELQWEPSIDDVAVLAYDLYRDGALLATLDAALETYEDFTALPESTYRYEVRARDAIGNTSDLSNEALAVTAGPEAIPPTAPSNLEASPGSGSGTALRWDRATDNTAVTGYEVYRDGTLLANAGDVTSYHDLDAPPGVATTYVVHARDAFDNASGPSNAATLAAPGPIPSLTFVPTDDATIREARPTRNYGLVPSLEVDLSSKKDILLRFDVAGLEGRPIERVRLRLFVLNSSPFGGDVALGKHSAWSETTVTWDTAPAAGPMALGAFGGVATGSWVELDLTGAVTEDGAVTLRLSSLSENGADYASLQDAGGRVPQLIVDFTAAPPPADGQPAFPIRATFYYPWFPETWTVNGAHVFYQPTLGYYASTDAAVQQAHIEAMTGAGLDAVISSWWGIGDRTDTRFAQLLDRTVALDEPLRWAVYHEGEGRADPTPEEIAADLTHLEALAQSPAYLRVDGRFVVFVYNAEATDSCHVSERWEQANASLGEPAYIVLMVIPGYATCPTQPDGWHNYAPAHTGDHRVGHSYMISPGFWRADEATPRLERDLARWQQDVRDMVASAEPWQLVTTFNEWGEGTAIEASAEWGTDYLEALADVLAPPPSSPGIVIAGAGDIGQPGQASEATARLLDTIAPSLVFTTGDNAYPVGALDDFVANYDPTWGRHRAITKPTPGNHEYLTADASGYFDYFGSAAGTAGEGWYAYDVGAWRVYALNSKCSDIGGCDDLSTQYQWLAADLAANPRQCALAMWHEPRFASGAKADDLDVAAFWQLLQGAGAELVVNGHDHNYQRYAPQDASGNLDYATGLVQIIVGTGGEAGAADPTGTNRLAANGDTRGVLKLTLLDSSYAWEFVPEAGAAFTDAGEYACH